MIDKRDIFIKGEKVILKSLSEKDIHESGWYGWFNDEETTEYLQHHYFPNTLGNQLEFYQNEISKSRSKVQLGILPVGGENIVGVVSLSTIDFINRKAEFGIVIGEKEARGKGLGTEALKLIVEHGFQRLGLNKIYLGVDEMNKPAIKSYEKVGFKIDGLLREDVLLRGKFHNTIIMSLLASEYYKISK